MRSRKHRFSLWLNEKEFEYLTRQAQKSGLKKEPFIRKLIMEEEIRARPPDDYYKLLKEINAIGVNINQIAHIANFERTVGDEKIAYVVELIEEVMEKVRDLE